MKKKENYFWVALKGVAMGAADIVPGVSGGTIAFLTGIYETLINSIKSVDATALKLLFTFKFKELWQRVNGGFLLSLIAGIGISILGLARIMEYLMEYHHVPLWSFFFGLILASAVLILREIEGWDFSKITALVLGCGLGVSICLLSPSETPNELWFVFISGMIAICAMILPGISGSFILLLLGKYEYVLSALNEFNISVILVFVAGAVVGIVSFSHFLSWVLKRFYSVTICALAGIMIGSLTKVWPFHKQVLKVSETASAEMIEKASLVTRPVLPDMDFATIAPAILFMFIGLGLVFTIERLAKRKS